MATLKKRVNITLEPKLEKALEMSAKRDNVPEATKAAELLAFALSIEEDFVLESMAKTRDSKKEKFITHKQVWG